MPAWRPAYPITLGYAATFLAGLIGIAYITMGIFTPILGRVGQIEVSGKPNPGGEPSLGKALGRMMYGITCFAILFLKRATRPLGGMLHGLMAGFANYETD